MTTFVILVCTFLSEEMYAYVNVCPLPLTLHQPEICVTCRLYASK